jgi:hypothetical protein
MKLRAEVLRFVRDDGGLDLLDLLLERLVSLSAEEARALDAGDPALLGRLETLLLCENEVTDRMRVAAWSARTRLRPAPAPAAVRPAGGWDEARALPELVSDAWRDPERMRRLAEEAAAGRRYLHLPGFIAPAAAARLAEAAAALPFTPMTGQFQAERRLLEGDELAEWRALMASPVLRRLFGAVLGIALPERLFINVWRLGRGENLGVHPDGRLYRGTLSLGLSAGWTAADGGAIAFGDPTPAGFVVRERWLPHLGDALLFAPTHDTWHVVEPVRTDRTRLSVTGWWTASPGAAD